MAGKARVHELAKEMGVEAKTILAKLRDMGEFVKSASSTVEAPVARRLRGVFAAQLTSHAIKANPMAVLRPSPSTPPEGEHDRTTALRRVQEAAVRRTREEVTAAPKISPRTNGSPVSQPALSPVESRPREPAMDADITIPPQATHGRPLDRSELDLPPDEWTEMHSHKVKSLWESLDKLSPNPERTVEFLADQGKLPKSDIHRLRKVRNRLAHPDGSPWPTHYDIDMALTTAYELHRRIIGQHSW